MFIIAYGNPFDGIYLTRPFDDMESACDYADRNRADYEDWNIVAVESVPEESAI